ncbi:E3 ubiquitin-protein ligase AIRP2-like [Benincasa hispida]|uniref:E3 ubiquitin-protein ligase AIRP2-like n=1 Tax=Benincasa hispida TaxID=102211 RepID=UPI001901B7BE|nr:E3 ubiquitin-protein ligase AIRP2-like [Benincasa hispida]
MLDCYQRLSSGHSYKDFLEFLEADMLHSNAFFISKRQGWFILPGEISLYYLTPVILYLLQWMDIPIYELLQPTHSSAQAVILPSLQRLCDYASQVDSIKDLDKGMAISKRLEHKRELLDLNIGREDECGIFLESRTKIVLPHCCHAMCTNCYHDWKSNLPRSAEDI